METLDTDTPVTLGCLPETSGTFRLRLAGLKDGAPDNAPRPRPAPAILSPDPRGHKRYAVAQTNYPRRRPPGDNGLARERPPPPCVTEIISIVVEITRVPQPGDLGDKSTPRPPSET